MQTEAELELSAVAVGATPASPAAPESTALESAAPRRARPEATPERLGAAAWAVAAGLLIGYVASVLFVDKLIGLSFPLFIALLVVVAALTAWRAGIALRPHNLWLALPALFFAAMVAVRADSTMRDMNMMMALGLGALWLYFLPRAERLDDSTVSEYAGGIVQTSLRSLSAPANELGYGYEWLRSRQGERSRTMHAVVRGVLLAVPILLVFAALLSTADAVFSRALSDLWNTVGFGDNVLRQMFWMALFAWFGCGVAACAMLGAQRFASSEARESDALAAALHRRAARRKRVPITLSMIETSIVLGGVIAMFAVFVAIQFRYFFGGDANIGVAGLTYAEYARRGFFELVAVAVLALGLLLALEWVTVRAGKGQHRLFRGLALALVALVGVMMFSAYNRMDLYQNAYGYTPLRVYVSVFISWLAGVFGFFVLMLFRARERIFSLGVLLCAIGFVGHLNLMNVEGTIAQRNIDRYRAGESLDGQLLWSFSVDAFAPMWGMYADESLPDDVRGLAANWLYRQREVLEGERLGAGSTVFSAHWARDTAYARLAASEFADGIPALGSGSLWEWYFEGRGR